MKIERDSSGALQTPKPLAYQLPPQILDRAADGLCWISLISAVTSVTLNLIQHALQPEFAAAWRHPMLRVASLCVLLLSIGFIAVQRSGRLSKRRLLDLGMFFQVAISFAGALFECAAQREPDAVVIGVSGIAVWMMLCGRLMHNAPLKSALTAALCVLMWPLAYWADLRAFGYQPMPLKRMLVCILPLAIVAIWMYVLNSRSLSFYVQQQRAEDVGSYVLTSRIGKGGMGEVWRAKHKTLARDAAVKLMRPEVLTASTGRQEIQLRKWFELEAQVTASLRSPHTGAVRLRAGKRRGLLLRYGTAGRHRPAEPDRPLRADGSGAGGAHPAPGLPVTGGGASSRIGASRYQAAKHSAGQARPGIRFRESTRGRGRQGRQSQPNDPGRFTRPARLCVTTEAYSKAACSTTIDFDAFSSAGTDELKRLAGLAREAFLAAPIPPDVAAAVIHAYHRLGGETPVAVRSSATAEDLPHASFAGQQDTYLNITGTGAVLDAVRRCWASLWTDRAVIYRSTNQIDHRAVRLAVVVQQMVDAQIAGVLFTANPVTGRRRQAVIDASPGLGEAVVSGTVNPDHFVVDPDTREILERRLGDKRISVRSLPGGGTRQVESDSAAGQACLTDDQVRSLTALGEKVEAHFAAPQDTEWAIDARGQVWLTQARPITTLFPQPVNAQPPEILPGEKATDLRVYFCFSVAQGLYRPLTPMGLAAFRLLASSAAEVMGIRADDPLAGPPAYAEAGQRVFIDATGTLHGRVGRALLPRVLDMMEARSAALLRPLLDDPRLPLTRRSRLPFARRALLIAFRFGVPLQMLRALIRPEAARARIDRTGAELTGRLTLPRTAGAAERLDFIERVLGTEAVPLLPKTMPAAAAGFGMLALAARLLGKSAGPGELQTVLRGLPHNVTTEMDLYLWSLAKLIRDNPDAARVMRSETAAELCRQFRERALPEPAQHAITEFLSKYGHRGVAEIDTGMPRWSDDPTHILGVLANYLRLDNLALAPDALFARGAAEAEAAIESLVTRARRRGRLRARLVRFALERTRQLAGLREIPKYYMVITLAAVRRELAKIGAEIARSGRIENADDVFFLDLSEVRAAIGGRDLRHRVAERRQAYDLEMRRRHVPSVLLSDGTEPEATLAPRSDGAGLAGTPASAGKVTAIARVIFDPVGARLEPGEILVAPSTDPGWTPLFLTAGGLVMEMGGANSHGAVVAREYGIPAVVGVPGATRRIVTGQRITVDGAGGTIDLTA